MTMRILDMSAGNRAVWFDKSHPMATFVDVRESVKPDVVADSRNLKMFDDGLFDLVVFDPPHVNFGANAQMSKTYGHHTTDEIRDIIKRSSREAHRTSKRNALMAFKWNDHDQKLQTVLALMKKWWEPLFGHSVSMRTKHSSQTYWVLLRRRNVST